MAELHDSHQATPGSGNASEWNQQQLLAWMRQERVERGTESSLGRTVEVRKQEDPRQPDPSETGSRSRSVSEEVMELSLSADLSTLPSPEELQVLHNMHLHSTDYDEGDIGLFSEHHASLHPVRTPTDGAVSHQGGKVSQLPQMIQTLHKQQPVEQFQQPEYSHSAQPAGQSRQQSDPPLQLYQPPETYPPAECSQEEVLEDRRLFVATLQRLHEWLGLSEKIPRLGGRELDLHMLYRNVCSLGGCESVIARKLWRDAAESFHYPETITNVSFSLRRAYLTFLWDYEQIYMHEQSRRRILPGPSSQKDAAAVHGGSVEPTTPSVSSLVGRPAKKRKTADNLATSFVGLPPGAPTQLVAAARTAGRPEAFAVGSRGSVTLDARFDAGYFVTVKVGKQEFQGMLYYPPPQHTKELAAPEKKERTAPAPKPNRTPFNFFSMGTRLRAKEAHPEMSQTDITRKVGKMWQAASEAEKAPYVALANQDKHRYQAELDAYNHRLAAQAASEAASQAAKAVTVAQQAMSNQEPHATSRMQGSMHRTLTSEGSIPMQ